MSRFKLKLPIVEVEFTCFNCDETVIADEKPELFCSERCKQEAAFVRYFRSCKRDGRINQIDVQEAFQIKIAHILAGGYKSKLRRLPLSIRQKVYERDNETCQKCGKPGRDIDHINDGSGDLKNLQVLCRDCHNKKTKSNFKELTSETENWEEKSITVENLRSRTESEMPKRISDDEEKWKSLWRGFKSEREFVLKRERLLQYARNEGFNVPNHNN